MGSVSYDPTKPFASPGPLPVDGMASTSFPTGSNEDTSYSPINTRAGGEGNHASMARHSQGNRSFLKAFVPGWYDGDNPKARSL